MIAYYNEFDPFAAAWLRELIKENLIAPGDVDERSIKDVQPEDLRGYRQVHFFAGIGGWSLALRLAGWADDASVWTGSCPCQPFSAAGKQKAQADERHLWPEMRRLVAECKPGLVFGEQVERAIRHGWLDRVFADLETEGYACGAAVLGAHSVGAPQARQRLYWVADSKGPRRRGRESLETRKGEEPRRSSENVCDEPWPRRQGGRTTLTVADVLSPPYGVPGRMGRLRGYGNAIVPQVAATFIQAFLEARSEPAASSSK